MSENVKCFFLKCEMVGGCPWCQSDHGPVCLRLEDADENWQGYGCGFLLKTGVLVLDQTYLSHWS